jgi:hypothetical protein
MPGATHAASSSATEANAARNIEQSLQLLVEAIPLAGLRQAWLATNQPGATASGVTASGATRIPLIPTPKDLFDIAVERAEESVLELLTAHKGVLGMNALYKCLTMIECVELYGSMTPPAYVHSNDPASAEDSMHAMLSYAIALYSQSVASGAIRLMAGARLQRGASSASMQSLTSDASAAHSSASVAASTAAATTARNQVVTNGQGADGINMPPLNVLLGWLRLPAFSAHLHKTVLTMLLEVIHAHEQAGRHKYQYDVSKGEVTHLPAHILKHLKVELPLRLRCLTAYTTIQELGASADRTRAGYVRQHGAFNSFQAVNLRQLFDRTAPAAPLPPPPTAASTAASQFSLLGSMSPLVSTASTVPPSPYASQTAATPVHGSGIAGADASNRHSIDDEVAALCKLSTPRAEAAMWALRAAQNAELQAARQSALAQAAQASAMTAIGGGGSVQRNASMETFGADRLASADSASSSSMSRAATQLIGGTSVRAGSLTPTSGADHASMGVESGNSHSKVRRVVGKDAPLSPSVPSLSLDMVDTPTTSSAPREPFFPTEYAKRSDTGRRSPQLRRTRSRSSSSEAGDRLRDSTADDELHSSAGLSFSAFRAFHLAYGKAADNSLKHTHDATSDALVRFFPIVDMSGREPKGADAHFRTNEVVSYILHTEYAPNGTAWSQLRDHGHHEEGAYDTALVRASGAGALRRFHSASSGLSGGSTPQGSGTPRQGSAQKSAAFGTPAAGPVVEANQAAITAAKLLQLPATPVESVTSAPLPTATGGVTGSQKSPSPALFTMLWCPTYTIPHALLNFLIAPLAGDIFSLTSLHEALTTMGIANKLVGLKHIAPLFCAHLARQQPEHLITEVLVKKLSTFPLQRWLRDSLLTFQDTLTALKSAHSRGGGGRGAAPVDNSASAAARVSGEKDTSAADGTGNLPSSDETAANEPSGTSGADAQWAYTLASEIRDVAASSASQADISTTAQDSEALPSYDEFIR